MMKNFKILFVFILNILSINAYAGDWKGSKLIGNFDAGTTYICSVSKQDDGTYFVHTKTILNAKGKSTAKKLEVKGLAYKSEDYHTFSSDWSQVRLSMFGYYDKNGKHLYCPDMILLLALSPYVEVQNIEDKKVRDVARQLYSAKTPWASLKGRKLPLDRYGLAGDGGEEANVFYNGTGEYILLQSNGMMAWNARLGGNNTSYYYTIVGDKLYYGNSRGSRENWIELVSSSYDAIKTQDNFNTYRYFNKHSSSWTSVKGKKMKLDRSLQDFIKSDT